MPRSQQVHLEILIGYLKDASVEERPYLEGLIRRKTAEHDASVREAKVAIRDFDIESLKKGTRQAVRFAASALGPLPESPESGPLPRVRDAVATAQASGRAEDYHQLRIELKRLRYTLEAAGRHKHRLRTAAKKGQQILGDVHDRDEILEILEKEEQALSSPTYEASHRACRRLIERVEKERSRLMGKLELDAFDELPAG